MQPAQWLAALIALALLVLGIVGFSRTGVSDWSSANTVTLMGFHLTPARCLVYVLAGAVGALLALLAGTSRLYGWLLVIGFGVLVLWGLALTGTFSSNPVSGAGNPLGLESSDNWWHAAGLVLGLIVAVLPARRVIVTDEPEVEPVVERAPEGERIHGHHERLEDRDVHDVHDVRDDVRDGRDVRDDNRVFDDSRDNRVVHEDRVDRPADAGMEPMPAAQSTEVDEQPARRSRWWNPGSHNKPAHR
jgi:hypothetical protein